jgi:hypothetical protein
VATGKIAGRAMVGAAKPMAEHLADMNALTVFGRSFVSVGELEGDRIMARSGGPDDLVKVFVGSDELVKGVEIVGDVTRAGLYASLIARRTPVSDVPDLLSLGFNYGQTVKRP